MNAKQVKQHAPQFAALLRSTPIPITDKAAAEPKPDQIAALVKLYNKS